jgi:hypothetical protein
VLARRAVMGMGPLLLLLLLLKRARAMAQMQNSRDWARQNKIYTIDNNPSLRPIRVLALQSHPSVHLLNTSLLEEPPLTKKSLLEQHRSVIYSDHHSNNTRSKQ